MSMSYWGIIGFGVCIDDIDKYIDHEIVSHYIKELYKDVQFEEDVFDDDTFYGDPYTNFAEFLCEFDKDDIFTWEDSGDGVSYFLYEPQYPWRLKANDPKDENELKDKMVKILRRVCSASDEELKNEIKYISTVGMG